MASTEIKKKERWLFHSRQNVSRWSYDITKEETLECTFCSRTFENIRSFEKHLSTKSHKNNYNKITKCKNPDQIKEWMILCKDDKTLSCLIKQHNHIIHDVSKHKQVERVLIIVFKEKDATPYLIKRLLELIS